MTTNEWGWLPPQTLTTCLISFQSALSGWMKMWLWGHCLCLWLQTRMLISVWFGLVWFGGFPFYFLSSLWQSSFLSLFFKSFICHRRHKRQAKGNSKYGVFHWERRGWYKGLLSFSPNSILILTAPVRSNSHLIPKPSLLPGLCPFSHCSPKLSSGSMAQWPWGTGLLPQTTQNSQQPCMLGP